MALAGIAIPTGGLLHWSYRKGKRFVVGPELGGALAQANELVTTPAAVSPEPGALSVATICNAGVEYVDFQEREVLQVEFLSYAD